MIRLYWAFVFCIANLTILAPAFAWDNHALPTAIALSEMAEVVHAPKVKVETLDEFLRAEESDLEKILADEEMWARNHVAHYPKRPSKLGFVANGEKKGNIRERFLQAIRANPNMKLPLYLQQLPGQRITQTRYWQAQEVTLLPKSLSPTGKRFIRLEPAQEVLPIDVFATATDEPDYGLDIGLWDDSGTSFGSSYHFGTQPFGNPKLEFASQAAFHMGFYHEPSIVYRTADYLMRTYPEYRIHLFFTLARFAFASGHHYWGWRFAGWGAHYIQDLTQPYHATILPGVSTTKMLLYGFLDLIGIHGPKTRLVQRASDEHIAVEHHVYCALVNLHQQNDNSNPLALALKRNEGDAHLPYSQTYVRSALAAQTYGFAERISDAVLHILPLHANASSHCKMKPMPRHVNTLFIKLMQNLGMHTRNWVRVVINDGDGLIYPDRVSLH